MAILNSKEIEEYSVEQVRRFFRGQSVKDISVNFSENDKTEYVDGNITYDGITIPTQIKGTIRPTRTGLKSKKLEFAIKNPLLLIIVCNIPDSPNPTNQAEEQIVIKYAFVTDENYKLLTQKTNFTSNKECFKPLVMEIFKSDFIKYYNDKTEIPLTAEELHDVMTKTNGELKISGKMYNCTPESETITLKNVSIKTEGLKITRKLDPNAKFSFDKYPKFKISDQIIMDSVITNKNNYTLKYPGIELKIQHKDEKSTAITNIMFKNVPLLNFEDIKKILKHFESTFNIDFQKDLNHIKTLEEEYIEVIPKVKKDYRIDISDLTISNSIRLFFIDLYNNDIVIKNKDLPNGPCPLFVDKFNIFVTNRDGKGVPLDITAPIRIKKPTNDYLAMKFSEFILFNSSWNWTKTILNYPEPTEKEIHTLLNNDYSTLPLQHWLNFFENVITLYYENKEVMTALQNKIYKLVENEEYIANMEPKVYPDKLIIVYAMTRMILKNYSIDEFDALSKMLNSNLYKSIYFKITKYDLKFQEHYQKLNESEMKNFDDIMEPINELFTKKNAF